MNFKLKVSFIVFISLLKYISCNITPETTTVDNDFEKQVDKQLGPIWDRIEKLNEYLEKLRNTTQNYDDFQAVLAKGLLTTLKSALDEIKAFYVKLREESIQSGILPDTDVNRVEIIVLSLVPKYSDKLYQEFKKTIQSPVVNEELRDELIVGVEGIKTHMETCTNNIKEEIEGHPKEWKILDPIMNLMSLRTAAENQTDDQVKMAFVRGRRIIITCAQDYEKYRRQILLTLVKTDRRKNPTTELPSSTTIQEIKEE